MQTIKSHHNTNAPYWAITFIILIISGLSTIWFELGWFWNGYLLDMAGPAWSYILFRGLFTEKANNKWTNFFTPKRTLIILLSIAYSIETLQYFKVYQSTFDLWDLLAYTSIIFPIFLIDLNQSRKEIDLL